MYHIHQTEGLIIKGSAVGEADKRFLILTEEFGLISASAKSVRELKSKLRYGLQDFSYGLFSLVKGRDRWRVTNVVFQNNFFGVFRDKPDVLKMFARIFLLVSRLAPEEEKNLSLFEVVRSSLFFAQESDFDAKTVFNFECIIALRVLHCFGYLGRSPDWREFTDSPFMDFSLIAKMDEMRKTAVATINSSLQHSHL